MEPKSPNEENNHLNEPQAAYTTRRLGKLRVFSSFDEAAEAEARDVALQLPADRIRETVELILRAYGITREQLTAGRKKLHINIISGQ